MKKQFQASKLKVAFNNAGRIGRDNDVSDIITNLSTSTNNVIINGLLEKRVDEIYQFNSSSVRLNDNGKPVADTVRLKLMEKSEALNNPLAKPLLYGDVACLFTNFLTMNLNKFDIILIRGDDIEPDPNTLEAFDKAKRPLYVNTPKGTLAANDKFKIKRRAEKYRIKIPKTYNAKDFSELLEVIEKIRGKDKVVKARYGFGGKEVWKVTPKTTDIKLWKIFKHCEGGAIVQEYRPIIEKGDLRLNVFDGEVLGDGAILRQAGPGNWQTNIDLGGSQKPYNINKKIKVIAKKVSKAYPKVRLQGVDLFLDGTFIETNAFPSTIGYTQKHFGVKAEVIILDKIFDEIPI